MRHLFNYLLGALAGIGLVLGSERAFPEWFGHTKAAPVVGAGPAAVATASEPVTGASPIAEPPHQTTVPIQQSIDISRRSAITRAASEVSPAVVGISVISVREYRARHPFADDPFLRQFFPDQIYRQKVENLGSGFLISPDGYVLTNEHVVHEASQVIVTTTAGDKFDAVIVGYDYDSDIALLKIEGRNLPYIRFGDSDDVIIGEWAIAIGNPFGLFSIHSQPSVSVGVVSAVDRDFERNREGRLYLDMVQTDAAINRGNSGGPLVNAEGDLIGMNTMIFTEGGGGSIGLGFAIPSNKLNRLFEDLKGRGKIERDFWIGFQVGEVTRLIARSLRLNDLHGAVVTDVESGSPAEKAGLEPADVIVAAQGRRIESPYDLLTLLRNADLRVGDMLKLTIWRSGSTEEREIRLGKR